MSFLVKAPESSKEFHSLLARLLIFDEFTIFFYWQKNEETNHGNIFDEQIKDRPLF